MRKLYRTRLSNIQALTARRSGAAWLQGLTTAHALKWGSAPAPGVWHPGREGPHCSELALNLAALTFNCTQLVSTAPFLRWTRSARPKSCSKRGAGLGMGPGPESLETCPSCFSGAKELDPRKNQVLVRSPSPGCGAAEPLCSHVIRVTGHTPPPPLLRAMSLPLCPAPSRKPSLMHLCKAALFLIFIWTFSSCPSSLAFTNWKSF